MKTAVQIGQMLLVFFVLLTGLFLEEANGKFLFFGEDKKTPEKKKDPSSFLSAPEALQPSVRHIKEGRWAEGLEGSYAFIKERQSHEEGYNLAQFNLARAAWRLGLRQIATEYYAEIVRASMDPQIFLLALRALERITHEPVYDELTIIEELIYDREFGSLPNELNDFVHYYQALMDYRNGYPRWASLHLERMKDKGDYYYRGLILRARWALKVGDVDKCRRLLEEVVLADDVDIEITNEAKLALARVLYELEDFDRAYRYYREIEAHEVNLSDVIFEEAWAKYRRGDYKKAMGRLVAFSAPSFQSLFQPEQYILQALIYMQYCHYNAAQETVISFLERYGFLLERIHHRKNLSESSEGRQILENMPALKKIKAYSRSLVREIGLLDQMMIAEDIKAEFRDMYQLKMIRLERLETRTLKTEIEQLKRILFGYEEQMNLMAYESGMDQYKKIKQLYYNRQEGDSGGKQEVPWVTKSTYYLFNGEFWSDELDDYSFMIDDYCQDSSRWEEKSH